MVESKMVSQKQDLSEVQIKNISLSFSQGEPLAVNSSAPKTLSVALFEIAQRFPNKNSIYLHSDGSIATQSYRDLLQKALKILAGLREVGLKSQDKVILQLENNQDFVEAFWGCILGGFVPIPLAVEMIMRLTKEGYEPEMF